jgi:hypothetical protein
MATFNYPALRSTADKLIQQFGMKASLVSRATGVYRDCWVVVSKFNPRDAEGRFANPVNRQVLIAAGLGGVPAAPPDAEGDTLVTYVQPPSVPPVQDEVLNFTQPVEPIKPAGIVVLYEAYTNK